MLRNHVINKMFFVTFALMLASSFSTVHAIPCGSGGVSGAIACQNGIGKNDFLHPLAVNEQSFFGFDDWLLAEKQNTPGALESEFDAGWTVGPLGGSPTGTWAFDTWLWSAYDDIMIVLKGGKTNNNGQDIRFSGYLLDQLNQPTNGTWDTGGKNVSHLSLYVRGGSTPPSGGTIPEPASLALVTAGLIGLARRRGLR